MREFFDLTEGKVELIPMYGTVHFISLGITALLVVLLFIFKDNVRKLANNRKAMLWITGVFLLEQAFYWTMIWSYQVMPMYERFPLHLCGSLSLLMPILVLVNNDKLLRFFGYWSICAGFISMVNPSYGGDEIWSYAFISYHIRHWYLLLLPIFMQVGRGYKHSYKTFLWASLVLASWAFLIFLLDWWTGANYMHLGQNNLTPIPFLPKAWTVWPWNYPSYTGTGVVLTHIAYGLFKLMERANRRSNE